MAAYGHELTFEAAMEIFAERPFVLARRSNGSGGCRGRTSGGSMRTEPSRFRRHHGPPGTRYFR
jgi:hypothetical protein